MTTADADRFRSALCRVTAPEAEAYQAEQKVDDAAWWDEQRRQQKLLDEAWRNAAANVNQTDHRLLTLPSYIKDQLTGDQQLAYLRERDRRGKILSEIDSRNNRMTSDERRLSEGWGY